MTLSGLQQFKLSTRIEAMMDPAIAQQIAKILFAAARRRKLVSYPRFHSLFSEADSLSARLRALSNAVWSLGDCKYLDYGCLMALASGLPGDEFFVRFRNNRPREFEAVMGPGSLGRSSTKRRVLVDAERQRVFEHAAQALAMTGTTNGEQIDRCDGLMSSAGIGRAGAGCWPAC